MPIAFTGDFNYSKSRLFNPAINQFPRLEALFMESTYGGSNDFQPSRSDAELALGNMDRIASAITCEVEWRIRSILSA
jgi:predicted metal-dependent RNase